MRINDNHILESARLCLSPNHSERDGDEISLLVLHNISLPPGKFGNGYIEKFFTNKLDDICFQEAEKHIKKSIEKGLKIPNFGEGQKWLNTEKQLVWEKDIKGNVLLIDFWTYCCIKLFNKD